MLTIIIAAITITLAGTAVIALMNKSTSNSFRPINVGRKY